MTRVTVLMMMLGAALRAAAATPTESRVQAIQETFRYEESIVTPSWDFGAFEGEVILMDTVSVTESMLRRQLIASVAQNAVRLRDQEFSWKKGGLIRSFTTGETQINLGVWPNLEHSAFGNELAPIVRVKILEIRW